VAGSPYFSHPAKLAEFYISVIPATRCSNGTLQAAELFVTEGDLKAPAVF
jgi:hypothetical protein